MGYTTGSGCFKNGSQIVKCFGTTFSMALTFDMLWSKGYMHCSHLLQILNKAMEKKFHGCGGCDCHHYGM